jgi:tetratricopeptide (TPR) repeat protein
MRKTVFLSFALLTTPAFAAGTILDDRSLGGSTRYDRCLHFVDRNARAAYDAASAWQIDGGGSPAGHCAALALVGLRRYAEAATRLDTIGRDASSGDLVIRSQILDQAGNAWLLAGKGDLAAASFTRALSYSINDPDILSDRAQARAINKDWAGADADLSSALAIYPNRADLLILRASARHAIGKTQEARADINRALELRPNDADTLLERGNMKYEDGDLAGARADWQQIITVAPNSQAATTARDQLTSLTK